MRQFDIVELSDRTLAVILQADLLDSVNSRLVAPLVRSDAFIPTRRLHPIFRVGRRDYIMMTEKVSAVLISEIKRVVTSASDRDYDIRRALDIVFVGV